MLSPRMEAEPPPNPLDRLFSAVGQGATALLRRADAAVDDGMRALRKLKPRHSPAALDRLAHRRPFANPVNMGHTDLQSVLERRATVARELAALEAARADMVAEDQELLVAERVLRRLSGSEMVENRPPAKLAFIGDARANNDSSDD
jgi:hypothetical protein